MVIYVDIDETICTNQIASDYTTAQPISENIAKINALFDLGHEIVYWTARGNTTKIDWYDQTVKQLKEWGAHYHALVMKNKPSFDLLIDDKAINMNDLDVHDQRYKTT